jgi:hypothetical protein
MDTRDHDLENDLDRKAIQEPAPANHEIGPFPLSTEEVREFRAIVREVTGVDMSEHEAWNRATELLALFRMLIGPLPEDPEG